MVGSRAYIPPVAGVQIGVSWDKMNNINLFHYYCYSIVWSLFHLFIIQPLELPIIRLYFSYFSSFYNGNINNIDIISTHIHGLKSISYATHVRAIKWVEVFPELIYSDDN